ncbi:hypothetical protein M0802_004739 [Mischocyttarus mexicanus]|nr:hypothetical protein M0802_004739 [Mischocyttarus mexicanus]
MQSIASRLTMHSAVPLWQRTSIQIYGKFLQALFFKRVIPTRAGSDMLAKWGENFRYTRKPSSSALYAFFRILLTKESPQQ